MLGGGSSIRTDWWIVRVTRPTFVVGMTFGRIRSVSVAIPTGMSPSRPTSASASRFDRSSLVGDWRLFRALIESDVSKTRNTCASRR
jgi:hypothetical protein